jgi:hypothetical protein
MRKSLLFTVLLIFTLSLQIQAQKDTAYFAGSLPPKDLLREGAAINVSIYPVPVKDNSFTIKTDRDISFVKITNIIGQDILRAQYNDPEQLIRILLDNPKRGMYLVTINFSDGTRVVKKIMVEEFK